MTPAPIFRMQQYWNIRLVDASAASALDITSRLETSAVLSIPPNAV